jgi:hypothetical protein
MGGHRQDRVSLDLYAASTAPQHKQLLTVAAVPSSGSMAMLCRVPRARDEASCTMEENMGVRHTFTRRHRRENHRRENQLIAHDVGHLQVHQTQVPVEPVWFFVPFIHTCHLQGLTHK